MMKMKILSLKINIPGIINLSRLGNLIDKNLAGTDLYTGKSINGGNNARHLNILIPFIYLHRYLTPLAN